MSMSDSSIQQHLLPAADSDPEETAEWREALASVLRVVGPQRVHDFSQAAGEHSGGDLVVYQPHSAPGVNARAFDEGRLSEQDLGHYRQEITARVSGAQGLCSYPHPWLMPDFWQFPTGSMCIG